MTVTQLEAVHSDGHSITCRLEASESGPPWTVNVVLPEGVKVSGQAEDIFDALCETRRGLEARGYILCCNGARVDAYPSAMSRSMSDGRLVYRLRMGKKARRRDLLDVFRPAPSDKVGTVAEQREYFDRWLKI
jgi:hypothetical protein